VFPHRVKGWDNVKKFRIASGLLGLLGGSVMTLAVLVTASPALAGSTACTGTISSQTITGNLVVPAGGSCFLVNVVVNGNVSVEAGATLAQGIFSPYPQTTNYIYGNVYGIDAADISLAFAYVEGSVTVQDSGGVALDRVFITNNARFDGNDSLFFHDVGVSKNLSCTNNGSVRLFFFGAGGHASGQCAYPFVF
jgi:hypothetical protein